MAKNLTATEVKKRLKESFERPQKRNKAMEKFLHTMLTDAIRIVKEMK